MNAPRVPTLSLETRPEYPSMTPFLQPYRNRIVRSQLFCMANISVKRASRLAQGRALRSCIAMLVLALLCARGAVQAGETRETSFAPVPSEAGLAYANLKVASEPWSIHVLRIDRSRKDLTFFSAHAKDKVLAVSLIADQARGVPR